MIPPCFALQLFSVRHRVLMEYMAGRISRSSAQKIFEASGLANYAVAILLVAYAPDQDLTRGKADEYLTEYDDRLRG